MTTRSSTRTILKDRKLAPKKKLGQNFLVNKVIIEQIIAKANPKSDDSIIEFGVGLGAMTIPLAQIVKRVIGLEIDAGIVAFHQETSTLPENVTLIHTDILKHDFNQLTKECGGLLKIIANLPYSISNPLLFKLIEHLDIMGSAVLMLQKEVGLRLTASPGTKEYGVLSVLLGACASVKKLMVLGPDHFHPRPKVDSVVVKIVFHPVPDQVSALPEYDPLILKKVVKAAFQQRRKTLVNSLSSTAFSAQGKDKTKNIIIASGLAPTIRPDQISVHEYINLANEFKKDLHS
jgi:16S rRNA (adenine1518-N6/adenine1519-N6)-dimethyltransferase